MEKRDAENMMLEAVRQAELSRDDWDLTNEFDAAIYSLWFLTNPLELDGRDSVGTADFCDNIISTHKAKKFKFTAHAHHDEPIERSPDDIWLYGRLSRTGKNFVHFIIDRFKIFKAK